MGRRRAGPPSGLVRVHDQTTSPGNASVQWRGLQQFVKWAVLEKEIPFSPMHNLEGPNVAAPMVPVLEIEQLRVLLAAVAGQGFTERRDNAIIRLLIDTGVRRDEIAGLKVTDVNLLARDAVVTGRGSKTRIVRFGAKTAKAPGHPAARRLASLLRLRATDPPCNAADRCPREPTPIA
jgi:integrase/recombinase XerC